MKPQIRPMTRKDKPAVLRILRDTPEFKPMEVVVAEEVIDSYLGDPVESGYHIIVAGIGRRVVGYLAYGPTPLTEGTWDLYWAAVAREEQGHGIGRALFSHAEGGIEKAGGRLAVIETSSKPEYARTRRFHRRIGYSLACRVKDFYAPGDDKLIFLKHFQQGDAGAPDRGVTRV
jgi:ribosomal protein S18 acetylase RimI-like enzyme